MQTDEEVGATSGGFSYELDREGNAAIVRLSGELDMATAPALAECLERLRDNWLSQVVLDLSRLEFCDSSGINLMVQADSQARERGSRLVLRSPMPQVLRVLELSSLTHLLERTN